MTQNTINTAILYIQQVRASTAATTTSATAFPHDNTIPQNTEGTEMLTATITPVSASSTLLIKFTCAANVVTQNIMEIGLFQDSTADALSAWQCRFGSPVAKTGQLQYTMTSGTTSSTTFKIRMGNVTNGTNGLNLNSTASRVMGGISSAWLTIDEYL